MVCLKCYLDVLIVSADQFSDTDGTTIFVKGFDKYLGEEEVRKQLTETFAECGAVSTVRLPTDRESGELKGIGFIEFGSVDAKVGKPLLGLLYGFYAFISSFAQAATGCV